MLGDHDRRGFLARVTAAAAAVVAADGLGRPARGLETPGASDQDKWLDDLKGKYRCLFDFPNHADGLPLIHMLNFINTYKSAYGVPETDVNAVGTFYFVGPTASLPAAFNDTMWAKYKFGETLKLVDPKTNAPATRNMFFRPQAGDPVLFHGQVAAASIENLQKLGATFLLCNNAFMFWVSSLSQAGMGTAAEVEKELRANLLPGVVTVPAMVIAIQKAQSRGIAYNRQ